MVKYLLFFVLFIEHLVYTVVWIKPKIWMNVINSNDPIYAINKLSVFLLWNKLIQITSIYLYFISTEPIIKFNKINYTNMIMLFDSFILIICGQILNFYVYKTLGKNGVYYGSRLGLNIPYITS